MWNWDNGTVENWSGVNDDTQLTIEPGRSDTLGLGATNGPPYASGLFPVLEITGQDFLPGSLVGNVPGDRLPMTGEIFIDTNRTLSGHGNYVDVWLLGEYTTARFLSYPYDGVGTIEDLGDGWYRHHLANLFHSSNFGGGPAEPTTVQLQWNVNFDASSVPIVFDNFTITATNVPETSSAVVFIIGCLDRRIRLRPNMSSKKTSHA